MSRKSRSLRLRTWMYGALGLYDLSLLIPILKPTAVPPQLSSGAIIQANFQLRGLTSLTYLDLSGQMGSQKGVKGAQACVTILYEYALT